MSSQVTLTTSKAQSWSKQPLYCREMQAFCHG